MGTKKSGGNMPTDMPTGQARAAKERCNGMVGKSLGCKEGQHVRHGDKEIRPEAGGHCIKNNAKKKHYNKLKKVSIIIKTIITYCSNNILVHRHQGSARVYCLAYLSKLEQNKTLT